MPWNVRVTLWNSTIANRWSRRYFWPVFSVVSRSVSVRLGSSKSAFKIQLKSGATGLACACTDRRRAPENCHKPYPRYLAYSYGTLTSICLSENTNCGAYVPAYVRHVRWKFDFLGQSSPGGRLVKENPGWTTGIGVVWKKERRKRS